MIRSSYSVNLCSGVGCSYASILSTLLHIDGTDKELLADVQCMEYSTLRGGTGVASHIYLVACG